MSQHTTRATKEVRTITLLSGGLAMLIAGSASAQLTPERLYYGVNRAIPMTVKVPEGKTGEVTVKLLEAGTAKELASAGAAAGAVNLATLFPQVWSDAAPKVVYAQLAVGEEKVGPAVVLQPMLTPALARLSGPGKVQFMEPPKPVFSGVRAYVDKHVKVETSVGDFELALRAEAAPNTAWNFRQLVEGGFYTDISIHRIAKDNGRGQPFVVQAGDPNGNGQGGPGYNIDLEKSPLVHDFGVVSMARTGDPNSAGSQFFVCLSREGTSFLDGNYCTFGEAVSGAETILKLESTEIVAGTPDQPVNPPKIKSAKLVDAPAYGTGPKALKRPGAEGASAGEKSR